MRDNKVDKSVEGRAAPAIPTHRKRANGVAPAVGGEGAKGRAGRHAGNGVRAKVQGAPGVRRGKWAWPVFAGETDDWTVRGAASSNKIQSLGPKECESPGFFPTLGVPRGGEQLSVPLFSPLPPPPPPPPFPTVAVVFVRSSIHPLFPPFSFPSPLKGVRAAPFDGSMILLRHYRASQTPNCSAYRPYYLT